MPLCSPGAGWEWTKATVRLSVMRKHLGTTPQSTQSVEACEQGPWSLLGTFRGPSNAWNPSGPFLSSPAPPRAAHLPPGVPWVTVEAQPWL